MIEAQLRANGPFIQKVYDRMPYPIQNLLTSARGWFLVRNRYRQDMYALLRELRSHEHWNPEQVASYQLQELRRIVEHAQQTVPFYASYPAVDLKRPQDITRYPILNREVVHENAERLVSQRSHSGRYIWVKTTGTTGSSLKVAYTQGVARRAWAFRMRQWAWAGIEPRQPRVTLFGSRVIPPDRTGPPYWTYNLPEHQVLMSIFHLS